MATIHDVALPAEVSTKTVLRMLNDHESVRARTRERVRAAMKALDYHPIAMARHLRSSTAACEVIEYLFSLGHERIGHIFGHPVHAAMIWPSLTSLRQPFVEIAQRAMNKPDAWNANEAARRFSPPSLAQHSLAIRESTGPVRKALAGRAIQAAPAINLGVTDTIWEVA